MCEFARGMSVRTAVESGDRRIPLVHLAAKEAIEVIKSQFAEYGSFEETQFSWANIADPSARSLKTVAWPIGAS
jgi:hypothetical protein